jgi:hypothetical protein
MPVKKKSQLPVPVKIKRADASLETIRQKMQKLGITQTAVSDAVKWARKRIKGKGDDWSPCYSLERGRHRFQLF